MGYSQRAKILALLGILPELACGASPLLHHATPSRNVARGISDSEEAPCPLRFERVGYCGTMEWVRTPGEEEPGVFLIRLSRPENGVFVPADAPSGLKVMVKLWMPDMGHGSSPVKVVRPVGVNGNPVVGAYRAEDVHFVMPGAWEIRLMFKDSNGSIVDQAISPYQVGG
jgi:hypothetical protein